MNRWIYKKEILSLVENQKFNRGKDKKIWFETEVLKMLKETWKHTLIEEYESLIEKEKKLEPWSFKYLEIFEVGFRLWLNLSPPMNQDNYTDFF